MKSKHFKIHRGAWQGRHFHYPPKSPGPSSFTPGVLKEAVFELLLNRISHEKHRVEDYAFFDLSAGSGQMALEALSLGFQKVYISEVDAARVAHIKKELGWGAEKGARVTVDLGEGTVAPLSSSIEIYCRDFRRMAPFIHTHLQSALYFDLPYSFWKVKKAQKNPLGVEGFLLRLEKTLVKQGGHIWVFLQGPRFFDPQKMKFIEKLEFRHYGRQHLSFWLFACEAKADSAPPIKSKAKAERKAEGEESLSI